MQIFKNKNFNIKTNLIVFFMVYLGGVLSVFSCIPYYTNIRHVYSPTAALPLFFVSIADSLVPNNGFNIPLYKVVFLHFFGGVPGVVLLIVASFLYKRVGVPFVSFLFYLLLSIFSLKYFYDSFYIFQWHSFFYLMMCSVNFIFSLGCFYFYMKNRNNYRADENLYFHVCLIFWLVWCAFPRFDEIVVM